MFAILGVIILSLLYRLKYGRNADYPNTLNTLFGFALVGVIVAGIFAFTGLSVVLAFAIVIVGFALLIAIFYAILPAPR
ncbi:MAG: hypothetical protein WEB00_06875 [Dehalococcoidia bacterium]